jgi:hypothetical protein
MASSCAHGAGRPRPAYRTSELACAPAQSGCRALVAARAFKSSNHAAMVDEVG